MEVVASLSQGRTAAAQCGLFTYKSVPVIFEHLVPRLTLFVVFIIHFRQVPILDPVVGRHRSLVRPS